MTLSNTSIRIIVSLIAIPLILTVCIWGEIPFLIFVMGIGLLSYWEFNALLKHKNVNPNLYLGLFYVAAMLLNSYFALMDTFVLFILIISTLLSVELFRNKGSAILNVGTTFFGIFYLGMFSSTIVLIREFFSNSEVIYSEGGYLIISVMVSIWVCDSAAFFIGTAFGKHKLFPRVSPNKSWEGAIAGFIFAVITMIVAHAIVIEELSLFQTIIIGIMVGIVGQMGDLIESLIKRDAGVKDSSAIIPGHGGILDRFDSLLLTAPLVYLYLYFFVK